MITKETLVPLAFIKKEALSASYKGMRIRISMEKNGESTALRCVVWPEPFCFAKTEEDKKESADFEFNEDGLDDAVRWLNQQWITRQDYWEKSAKWSLS